MDVLKRSADGRVVILKRDISRKEGPFKFSYVIYYRAEEGDEFWKLISFNRDGFIPVDSYDRARQSELIGKYGPRAFAIARSIAEKPEKVPKELFQTAQLRLLA